MQTFSPINQINFIEIEVSEEIDIKNIKNFISTSLTLKNKNISNKDKIYLNYIKELKQYQVFILEKDYKYFDFQIFESFFDAENQNNESNLFVCDNFFALYKNGLCYYFQNIQDNIKIDEVIDFINKKFFINIKNVEKVDNKQLEELRKKYLKNNNKNLLKTISLKNNYSFKFYLLYIFLLCFFSIFSTFNNQFYQETIQENPNLLEKIKNDFKFICLENKIKPILKDIEKYKLNLNSFEVRENNLKIRITSSLRNDFYLFFEENKNELINSSINYIEDKNIYEAVANVRIF